jgi:hypothetical protein
MLDGFADLLVLVGFSSLGCRNRTFVFGPNSFLSQLFE